MRVKVWDENCKNDVDGSYYLGLKQNEDGNIELQVWDKNGNYIDNGTLLIYFAERKTFVTAHAINQDLPFKTDIDNQLLVSNFETFYEVMKSLTKKELINELREKLENIERSQSHATH